LTFARIVDRQGTIDIMTARPIVRFPDPRLRMATEDVSEFGELLHTFAGDLLDTMRAAPGIGIAAPHIGVPRRMAMIELSASDGVRIYVNPHIEWVSPDRDRHEEGSISMPGVTEIIERPARVRVRYQDLTGASHMVQADGLLAVCLQHEIDQLDGIFWTQRLTRLKRERLVKRFDKLQHLR
jgi:peptide deformylase